MSLNHLLNFTLSPREAHGSSSGGEAGRRRRWKTHSYNKEQFLQANCQFVVADRGDYSIHTSDPDLLVDWDSIELVRLFCHEIPSCPICLYPPRAAKITRCGHVYCWSCVLHYLSLGEKKWRKCPICYESIYKKDLKSVMALSTPQYSCGDVITMRLMVREKGSTHVVPSSQRSSSPCSGLPSLSAPGERFVKLLACGAAQSLELIVGPEREALTAQLTGLSPDEASETCFVELALEELRVRELDLQQSRNAQRQFINDVSPGGHTPPPTREWMPLADGYVQDGTTAALSDSEEEEGEGEKESSVSASSSVMKETDDHVEQDTDSSGSPETSSMEHLPATSTPPGSSSSSLIYFYQSADGQHLYLHTVNARCLVKEYGSLECAPDEIKARIVEVEQLSMTEEARARYKYISHLPVTCEFALCELDLRPPLVSRDTLAFFQGDLDQRRHRRARKRREEKRREKKTATQSPPSMDAFPLPTSLGQPLSPERIHDLLPQLTSSPPLHTSSPPPSPLTPSHLNPIAKEFVPGQSSHLAGTSDETTSEERNQDSSIQDGLNESWTAAPSFAEALRGKPPPVWPIRTPPRELSGAVLPGGGEEGEGGEGEAVPSFKEAFTEALLSAQVSTVQGQCSKKTAKKGRKKLVLFSTGGARGTHN